MSKRRAASVGDTIFGIAGMALLVALILAACMALLMIMAVAGDDIAMGAICDMGQSWLVSPEVCAERLGGGE